MLKALIVDDEPLARDELAYLLKRSKEVEIVGEADSIRSTLDFIQLEDVDVVFLDIQLADESGLELAQKLQDLSHQPAIVFATAYDEYALNAFDLHAIDYILKPFDEIRIQKTIEKLAKLSMKSIKTELKKNPPLLKQDRLAISVDERILLITFEEIIYIFTQEGKTSVVTDKMTYRINEPLINLERKLQNTSFTRVHRSYIVNLDKIIEIQPWFNSTYNLIMNDGEKVPVSRTYTKELKQLFNL
ncbi:MULTISPECIES: LytTR family transcriptional regulator DNA-binding domain-containing protein [Bacillaceae]|uniref:DNA-binding response regulator n=1 Tax=Gottfriedia luciferensis TaxID=178774 RepID=A0ABX2ZPE9_9BACI|nr:MULTISPECIES: LytTR family transcriptional regulator DNA-binding domain-containing protein [Bacillaceae]ODG91590.1 DNA-binding response regulator [Gottfriedia luciferensis]PGZ89025.1 DNA-binding response regulator [Bacillus sp. AFS029533]SFD82926.1 two component transcriptional regulator, LytTR family [Bacillus sp. UNCCL81]